MKSKPQAAARNCLRRGEVRCNAGRPPPPPPPRVAQVQGTGPFGLLTPGDVAGWVERARGAAEQTVPRVSTLLQAPGAADLAQTLSSQLARRFTARAIKLAFGMQQV